MPPIRPFVRGLPKRLLIIQLKKLKTVPAGYPGPRVDLIGCVHLITVAHLNTVKEVFQSCQWALECERHNKYAGSMVEVCGLQAKMQMCTNKIGPFRP